MKYRSNVERYSQFVFEHVDGEFPQRAASHRDAGLHNVIVAGESYGQGSSREHAALCPMYLGVKAVVAKSIERIHRANLINFGIIPFEFVNGEDYDKVEAGHRVKIEGLRDAVTGDGTADLVEDSGALRVAVRVELSDRQRAILLAGGLLNMVAGG